MRLQIQSIKVGFEKSKQQRFCVELKYGARTAHNLRRLQTNTDGLRFACFRPPPPLSFPQGRSRKLVVWKKWPTPRTIDLVGITPAGKYIRERQGLRDRRFLCKSATAVRLPAQLIVHVWLTDSINKQTSVKLETPDGTGSAVLGVLSMETQLSALAQRFRWQR